MRKAVLLRQKVPSDVERITFNSYAEIDDVWMTLFYTMCKKLDVAMVESWNWGGYRYNHLTSDFVERWMWSFNECAELDEPDLIFARGGFKEYIQVMKQYPNAFKMYYGAGKRYNPLAVPDATKYDLVLVDTEEQKEEVEKYGYRVELLIKPACENIFGFEPVAKQYDVVFIANAPQKKLKGHKWLFDQLVGTGVSIIQIGYTDREVLKWASDRRLNINFVGWVPRKVIPVFACRARVGVVSSTDYESCPRVIPELLLMNLPIVVRDTTRVSDLYVNRDTGRFASDGDFVGVLQDVLDNEQSYLPYEYYKTYLTTDIAASRLAEAINEIRQGGDNNG